jgi:glycosyltransferase involved in cell wall biosynthesis
MKKALMVGPIPPPSGGIASTMEDIVHSELSKEYDFDLFSRPFTFPPDVTGRFGKNLIRAKKYLRFLMKCLRGRYLFMHIHSPGHRFMPNAVYMLLARLAGIKVLLHLHGNEWDPFYVQVSRRKRFLTKRGLFLASRIVVIRQVWADGIAELGYPHEVSLLRNMIPAVSAGDPKLLAATRSRLNIGPDDFVVLLVGAGAVGSPKGIFDILEAAPKIAALEDSVRFVVAGGEEEPGQMEEVLGIIEREKLGKWMRILGDIEREEVNLLMEICSVYLLPSYIEGMPISLMEAMRSDAAIVATPVGAIPEMIENGISGLIINVGAPDEIVDSVVRLKRDDVLRQKLVEGGRRVFRERFEISQGIAKLRAIYKEFE